MKAILAVSFMLVASLLLGGWQLGTAKSEELQSDPKSKASLKKKADKPKPVSNGTWTDPKTKLTWQVKPVPHARFGATPEFDYVDVCCSQLSLDGGGWRVPTIKELRSLVRGCSNTRKGCTHDKGPADGCYWPEKIQGKCDYYWSSSPRDSGGEDGGWYVDFNKGQEDYTAVGERFAFRCVR